ncbi:histidine kinase, partial [Carnobacterium sp.]|uniref:sensor histidine kinase n=1 Tax=Carnobacterium sp. TaxID=48221 RepID=UPI0028A592A2
RPLWQAENVPTAFKNNPEKIYLDSLSNQSILTYENKRYYFLTNTAKNHTTFITLATVPEYNIFLAPKPLVIAILFLLTITLFVVLLMRLFKNYTVQVDSIVEGITASEIDLLERHIPVEGKHSELKTVSQTFNSLIDDINNHIKNNYILELKQKDAELRSLQSQINPHFLYNTLEFIRMSALKDGNEDLSEMVYLLGQLFRNSIKQQKKTTLYDEVENSKLYMQLFQTRYPNKIAYQFFV